VGTKIPHEATFRYNPFAACDRHGLQSYLPKTFIGQGVFMRLAHKFLAASFLAALGAGPVVAQTSSTIEQTSFGGHRRPLLGQPCTDCVPGSIKPYDPNAPVTPVPKDAPPMAAIDPRAEPSLAGTGGGRATALPQSIGDVGSYYRVARNVSVPVFTTVTLSAQTTTGTPSYIPVGAPVVTTQVLTDRTLVKVYDPVASRAGSGFKIGDNESPRPMDRISFTYNGYINNRTGAVPSLSQAGPTTVVRNPDTVDTTISSISTVQGAPGSNIDIHRGMFAFEKTFLDGNASVGIRLPIFGTNGNNDSDSGFVGSAFGDMSLIAKLALINDPQTNNVLSTGLVLTLPTGPAIDSVQGNINSVLFQPFVGFIYNFGPATYVQTFSSIVVPTNSNDVVVWFNDVSLGFVAYRNMNSDVGLTAIVPTIEVHVTTPLNHRGDGGIVQAFDIVSMTGGVHLGLGRQSWLTLGVNAPMTGPRPYEVEAIAQFNYRY